MPEPADRAGEARLIVAGGGTGGHLYPGLAIARALVRMRSTVRPHFVGARRGIEREVLPTSGFPYTLLDLHPAYRSRPWNNWKTIAGAVSSWNTLGALMRREQPSIVLGTGGYAAGLPMAYAVVHRLPLVQQAGDSSPGLTARVFSRWSREMYLAFPEAGKRLVPYAAGSLIDAGAPIEPPPVPRPDRGRARARWELPLASGLVMLIHGASQGSLAINRVVAAWIASGLPKDLCLIWSTGRGTFPEFRHLESERVRVREYLSPIADAYAASDFALTRAGAMTTAELLAWGLPGILVPLPTAAADHQTGNARALEAAGVAIHVPQPGLSVSRLDDIVGEFLSDPARLAAFSQRALARARPRAAEEIAARILRLIDAGRHPS